MQKQFCHPLSSVTNLKYFFFLKWHYILINTKFKSTSKKEKI